MSDAREHELEGEIKIAKLENEKNMLEERDLIEKIIKITRLSKEEILNNKSND